MHHPRKRLAIAVIAALPLSILPATTGVAVTNLGYEVVADGLDNARQLEFGPDGALYVAEAGTGGEEACFTHPEFDEEVCAGSTGAITRVDLAEGTQERVVTGLPSSADEDGNFALGPHGVSVAADGTLHIAIGLGGNPEMRDAFGETGELFAHLVTADPDTGEVTPVADLGAFEQEHDPDGEQTEEGENVDTNPYAVKAVAGGTYVADAGGNDILFVDAETGEVSLVAVLPFREAEVPPFLGAPPGAMMPMQPVPTSISMRPGSSSLYVGQLTGFPFPVNDANVYRVDVGRAWPVEPSVFAEGFTATVGTTWRGGELYTIEMARDGLLAAEMGGSPDAALVRRRSNGAKQELMGEAFMFGGGVTTGPDGMIYVTDQSVFAGAGRVLRFDPSVAGDAEIQDACPPDDVVWPLYRDIDDTIHEESIACLSWWEILLGRSATAFEPGDTLSRGQVASILARLIEASDADLPQAGPGFNDTAGTAHENNIRRLSEAGIVHGYEDGSYRPNQAVTRAQYASLVVATYEYVTGGSAPEGEDGFSDTEGSVHRDNISAAAQAGWVRGFADGSFGPDHTITRAQSTSMTARMLADLVGDGHAQRPS